MSKYEEFKRLYEAQANRKQEAQARANKLQALLAEAKADMETALLEDNQERIRDINAGRALMEEELREARETLEALNQDERTLRQALAKGKVGAAAEASLVENEGKLKELQEAFNVKAARLGELKALFLQEVKEAGAIREEGERLTREIGEAKPFTSKANSGHQGLTTGVVEYGQQAQTGPIYISVQDSQEAFYGRRLTQPAPASKPPAPRSAMPTLSERVLQQQRERK